MSTMSRRSAARGPVSVDELTAVAGSLFAERGYYNTSMGDIADAVGILKGSLYHHVASKDEILDRVLAQAADLLIDETEEIARSGLSISERFDRMVGVMVDNVRVAPHANVIYATEHGRLPREVRDKYRRKFRRHRQLFEATAGELFKQHGKKPAAEVDVALAITSIIALVSMLSLWYRPGRLGFEEIKGQFIGQARRILAVPD
jgi:AcrR family transcriptional regulator